MSGPLAIAAVTAALKDLLNNGLLDHDLATVGSYGVSASPPDRITTGSDEPNRLNLFLYQVTPNPGWRNVGLPARDAGGARVANPPLALDLHYLLTAYGSEDLNAEILLGFAMQMLHETPVLDRDLLRTVLATPSPVDDVLVPGIFGSLTALDLADQIEQIKISPNYLSVDDLAKMWSAMQARYRPSMAYTVSVVLIQATGGTVAPLPVLRRGPEDRGAMATAAPMPVLASARSALAESLPALRLGDDLELRGSNLAGADGLTAVLSNAAGQVRLELPVAPGRRAATLAVHLPAPADVPAAMDEWACGLYNLALRVAPAGLPPLLTNAVPFALAPRVALAPPANPAGHAVGDTVTLTCSPRLQSRQEAGVEIIFGTRTLVPASIATPADATLPTTITFVVPAVAAGTYLVRLRVDGIDSLPVTVSGTPPLLAFDPAQQVTVP